MSLKHWDEFERRRRPLHGLPQVPEPVPGRHRLRRRVDEHAQPAAQDGQEAASAPARRRRCSSSTRPTRRRSSSLRTAMIDVGLQGAARSRNDVLARPRAAQQTRAPPATVGHAAGQGAGDPLHQQEDAGRPAEADGARAARHRGQRRSCRSSATRRRPTPIPKRCSISPAAARSGCSRRSASRRRRCSGTPACRRVLPPGYLCCGYPQRGSGQYDKAEKIITDNRVLFHRVANTLNYLDIKTVVVSCGTCYDQLQSYEFDKIFPGCRHHRHPRVPAREGHRARRRRPACATCTTTPATRR